MTEDAVCPVNECSFEGSIRDIVAHVQECSDEGHTWEALGYEDNDEFQYETHLKAGDQLETQVQQARDFMEFDTAIGDLEGALWHYQQAQLFSDGSELAFKEQRKAILATITEVETDKRVQKIDDFVNQADEAADAGDQSHLETEYETAVEEYEKCIEALEEAHSIALDVAQERAPKIERQLREIRGYRRSLKSSKRHQSLRDLVTTARQHTTLGDQAFQQSDYETALEEYEDASECYNSLTSLFREFSSSRLPEGQNACSICRERYTEALEPWELNAGPPLQVCPSCSQFGERGILPKPYEVATEHRYVTENIESIQEGDVGPDWTSSPPSNSGEAEIEQVSKSIRNTQQMFVQLTGVVQELRRVPTPEDLDEYTDFGYLEYRDEFGSIRDALQEAGFEV